MAETNHHGFKKGESCLIKPVAFCDEMTSLVDKGRAVDIYLNFSKAFNTVSHHVLIYRLRYGPEKWTASPTKYCIP